MAMSGKQKRYLRGLAHSLKTVVTVGSKGLSENVLMEVDAALTQHELVKIKLPPSPRAERELQMRSISAATDAEIVQVIGRTGVLFRPADPPSIILPG